MKRLISYFIPFILLVSQSVQSADKSGGNAQNFGTGWVVAPHFIVTNNHVVTESNHAVLIKTDRTKLNAVVVVRDVANDLALLNVSDATKLPPAIPLVNQSPLMGEQVFTIGYPHPDVMGTNPKLTVGIINSLTGMANDPRTLQISTPLQSGNSGGPLLNMKGEAVGIVTSKLNAVKMFEWTGDTPQNVNYAVKVNYLRALIESAQRTHQAVLPILPVKQNTLVNLSQQIQDSIILIQSGVESQISQQDKTAIMKKDGDSIAANTKTLAMFTFMERGEYDKDFDLDDTDVYSKNTAKLIEQHIKRHERERLKIAYSQFDASAKWQFYDVHKDEGAKRLCGQHKVDYLLAVKNDSEILNYFEEIEFVMKDCSAGSYVSRTYYIEPKTQDKFIYESDIRTKLVKFLTEYLGSY